ncbi:hypothetical protein HZC31_04120 [Candidatus Woesearchaeota archaeon]|nr:hypothetical protein [Candidatus Woesearchaeota archaeon]
MEKKYPLIFDEIIVKQLQKEASNSHIRKILTRMLDKIELLGQYAGELLDSKLFLYEVKNKHPPLRLYYKHKKETDEIYVFEFEMKTSPEKQKKTISRLKKSIMETKNQDLSV